MAQKRHFRRAADRLNMTQPPLSRAIKQLETDLGTVLLHRSSTGITLTTAGSELDDRPGTLLAHAEQIRAPPGSCSARRPGSPPAASPSSGS